MRPEAVPIAQVSGVVGPSDGTLTMRSAADASALTVDSVVFMGGEALRVEALPGGTLVTVKRGVLGTDAVSHQDAHVYAYLPLLGGLRVEISVAPLDGDSVADERTVGEYVIDGPGFDSGLNAWVLQARSQIEGLDATLPASTWVERASVTGDRARGRVILDFQVLEELPAYFDSAYSFKAESGEVLRGEVGSGLPRSSVVVSDAPSGRGIASTTVEDVPLVGVFRRVLTIGIPPAAGDFRFSPGPTPSTDRASGTWTPSTHPIDVALCLLTSSRRAADGLELVNYASGYPNYSSLPVGFGAGILASDIDWAEWLDVKSRLGAVALDNIAFGAKPEALRAWLDREVLKPLGIHLVIADGKLRPIMPSAPVVGAATTSIGDDEILLQGENAPDLEVTREAFGQATSVVYELGPHKVTAATNAVNPTRSRKEIRIEVPSASADQIGFWQARATIRTRQSFRPRTQLDVALDASLWDLRAGDLALLTVAEVPDLAGSRGLTEAYAEVMQREPRIDTERGVWLQDRLTVYPSERLSQRVAPAAWVLSVSTNTATVLANRFTESDATGGLPTNDAAAFDVDDVVRLVGLDGTSAGGATQTVTAVSGDTITLDGDFSGNLAADTVIVFAGYDDAAEEQLTTYAWCAESDLRVGTSNGLPSHYGEP